MKVECLILTCWLFCGIHLPAESDTGSAPEPIPSESVAPLFKVAPGIYSGGEPRGTNAFLELSELGVRTVVSVDGSMPDVESAHAAGIRYVHIPLGYDRWSATNQLRLLAAVRAAMAGGPVLVHCHHGHHRGPAATALVCMQLADWDVDQARDWLTQAGTSTNYHGLFEMVEDFERPAERQLDAVSVMFPEAVEPEGIVDSMIAIDRTWENMKQILAGPQPDIPHLANESLLLLEYFREVRRLPETREKEEGFQRELDGVIRQVERLHVATAAGRQPSADSVRDLGKSCASCHRHFRD